MHNTTIKQKELYHTNLSLDSVQKMSFTDEDTGPFWINATAQHYCRYDMVIYGSATKEKTKAEFLVEL